MKKHSFLVGSFLIGVFYLSAQLTLAVDQAASTFILCKNQKTVRSLRITPEKDKECKVTYSKTGVDETIGQARSMQGCRTIVQNVQRNLEASDWRCRSVGSAAITTSGDSVVQ